MHIRIKEGGGDAPFRTWSVLPLLGEGVENENEHFFFLAMNEDITRSKRKERERELWKFRADRRTKKKEMNPFCPLQHAVQ